MQDDPMRLRLVGAAAAALLACSALAAVTAGAANAAGPWRLVGKSGDRNSGWPTADIVSADVFPGLEYQVTTQSTLRENELSWNVTCNVSSGSSLSKASTHGKFFPGIGKRKFAIRLPQTPKQGISIYSDDPNNPYVPATIHETGPDIDCFATIDLASSAGTGTVGLWLAQRDPGETARNRPHSAHAG